MELLSSLNQFRFHPVHQYNYICTSMDRFSVCLHHFLKLNFSFRCEYKRYFWFPRIYLECSRRRNCILVSLLILRMSSLPFDDKSIYAKGELMSNKQLVSWLRKLVVERSNCSPLKVKLYW